MFPWGLARFPVPGIVFFLSSGSKSNLEAISCCQNIYTASVPLVVSRHADH